MKPWTYRVTKTDSTPIVPDGCRDLIIKYSPSKLPQFFISELMTNTQWINTFQDQKFYGLRLPPGRVIDWESLKKIKQPESPEDLIKLANECTFSVTSINESLDCLSESRSSSEAASNIGVSLRTLQRQVKKYTHQTPEFWRLLARSRKAAKMILSGRSLADTAYHCFFADQAHMSREIKSWFGVTPYYISKHSKDSEHWIHQLQENGYDSPLTGEQISIRKPLLSVT